MPKPHHRQATWPPRVSIPPPVALPRPPTGSRQPASALTLAGGALGGGAGAVVRGRARSRARIGRTSIGVVALPLRGERAGGSGWRQEAPRALERGLWTLPTGWPRRARLAGARGGVRARPAGRIQPPKQQ